MRMHYYCHNLKTQNYNNAVPYILGFAVKKTKNNYILSFIDKKNKNLFIPDYFLLFLCIKKWDMNNFIQDNFNIGDSIKVVFIRF